ncbi:MAG: hypothetical protein KDB53_09065 [Planctomycetes bacterium]|nr:hypothetical protein [Planctomycetota bacterium]
MTSFRISLSFLVAFGIFGTTSCRSTGDRLEVPTPARAEFVAQRISCVFATGVEHVILGGYLTRLDGDVEGLILASTDGGRAWRRLGSETHPMRGLIIQSIHFNDALRGWLGGVRVQDGQTIPVLLRTEDGGGHWREAEVPETRAAVVVSVSELKFETDEEGSLLVVFQEESAEDLTANQYFSRDAGRSWTLGDFMTDPDAQVTDPGAMFVTQAQGYRIQPPLENGTQVLEYTGSSGDYWIPRAQLGLTQFDLYY